MPILQFHLVASAYPQAAMARLLEEASLFYAAALYPELSPPPVGRVRTFVNDIAPDLWATGGVPVSRGGAAAPYFTCLSLKGRPPDQLQRLLAGLTEITAHALGIDAALVRGQLIEIEPAHWCIGGTPASQARAGEISARAGPGAGQATAR